MIVILNYMQVPSGEGGSPQLREEEEAEAAREVDWAAEQRAFYLGKAFRIARKYHSRSFMTNFKSAVLQRLLQDNSRQLHLPQQEQAQRREREQAQRREREADWPYRSLLLKPNKSEHELLEIEFVSMCAEKIQAVFKGYLARKRFRVAFGRLKRFARGVGALVRGWKVRSVMRCLKVQEEARSLRVKRAEVEKEMASATAASSRFSQRRLDYLRSSLQAEMAHFHRRFRELYEQGAWVYEPRLPFPSFKRVQKWSERKQVEPMKENSFNQAELQTVEFNLVETQEPPKKKRVREMRDNARRGRNKQPMEGEKEVAKGQINNRSEASLSLASTNAHPSEDRPIQAKGAYSYAEQQNPPKIQQPSPIPMEGESNGEESEARRALAKKLQKKKLEKRQKYDPRKAIEQEKKRKKEQLEGKPKEQVHSEVEIALKKMSTEPLKEVAQSKSQKVLKLEKEDHSRSTVNLPRNKAKVEAKIDCWGNRKTVAKKPPQEYIKAVKPPLSNLSIELDPEPHFTNRAEPTPAARLAAKINERRGKGKERLEYSEEREKVRLEMEKNCEESERIKEELRREKEEERREAEAVKHLRAQAFRQRAAEEQKEKRKDLVYRSVEELSETYKNQYLTRFQNLFPKLSLLAAARTSEQHSRIPVLTLDSDFVDRMMEENRLNQRFWYTVSKMERRFKDFVKG